MTKTLRTFSRLSALLLMATVSFTGSAWAQDINEDPMGDNETGFMPYKGRCQGLFYDYGLEYLQGDMVGIDYVRTKVTEFILPNFLKCGRDLTVTLSGNYDEEGYCAIRLDMAGAQYDNVGYFYAPFNVDDNTWCIQAPNDLIVGPIHQAYSYYNADYDHLGLLYVGKPEMQFYWLDVKLNTDINESIPRTYLDKDDPYYPKSEQESGISGVIASSTANTYYNFSGVRVNNAHGLVIENGRKVIR